MVVKLTFRIHNNKRVVNNREENRDNSEDDHNQDGGSYGCYSSARWVRALALSCPEFGLMPASRTKDRIIPWAIPLLDGSPAPQDRRWTLGGYNGG